jgi:hypothetical protein
MLDRLVHNSNRIELSGESLRKKSAEKGSEKIVNTNPERVTTDG